MPIHLTPVPANYVPRDFTGRTKLAAQVSAFLPRERRATLVTLPDGSGKPTTYVATLAKGSKGGEGDVFNLTTTSHQVLNAQLPSSATMAIGRTTAQFLRQGPDLDIVEGFRTGKLPNGHAGVVKHVKRTITVKSPTGRTETYEFPVDKKVDLQPGYTVVSEGAKVELDRS